MFEPVSSAFDTLLSRLADALPDHVLVDVAPRIILDKIERSWVSYGGRLAGAHATRSMNFPGERMQPVNRKVFYRKLVCVAFILSMFFPMQASAFRTPFGDEVYRAVERGLAWVRTQLDGGAYNGVTTP